MRQGWCCVEKPQERRGSVSPKAARKGPLRAGQVLHVDDPAKKMLVQRKSTKGMPVNRTA